MVHHAIPSSQVTILQPLGHGVNLLIIFHITRGRYTTQSPRPSPITIHWHSDAANPDRSGTHEAQSSQFYCRNPDDPITFCNLIAIPAQLLINWAGEYRTRVCSMITNSQAKTETATFNVKGDGRPEPSKRTTQGWYITRSQVHKSQFSNHSVTESTY